MTDRHELSRRAAKAQRTAEKNRLLNLGSEVGQEYLRNGDLRGALAFLQALAPKVSRILKQEELDRVVA